MCAFTFLMILAENSLKRLIHKLWSGIVVALGLWRGAGGVGGRKATFEVENVQRPTAKPSARKSLAPHQPFLIA